MRTRECSWLTALPSKTEFRTTKFCPQTSYGSLVSDECPRACGLCPPRSTKSPSNSPTKPKEPTIAPTSYVCKDSSTFKFYTFKDDRKYTRRCEWLTAKPSDQALRIAKFCPQSEDGVFVRDECPISCGICPVPTQSPTGCKDLSTFTFITLKSSGIPVTRRCEWLSAKPSDQAFRIAKFCTQETDGVFVKDNCLLTCDNCPVDDVEVPNPTNLEATPVPSPKPTVTPTLTPTPNPCKDSPNFTFLMYKNGFGLPRQCSWLTAKADQKEVRTTNYCNQEQNNGVFVRDECLLACNNCPAKTSPLTEPQPTAAPVVSIVIKPCSDSDTYLFESTNSGGTVQKRKCSWLTSRSSKEKSRKATYCSRTSNGSLVRDECLLSCSNCPAKTAPPPKPQPTVAPTIVPTSTPNACKDSSIFEFTSYKGSVPYARNCSWLTSKVDQKEVRTTKFCNQKENGIFVRDECLLACSNCPVKTASIPKPHPTAAPVVSIVKPCSDSDTYLFESTNNGGIVQRKCSWLTSKPSKEKSRKATYCSQTSNGSSVKDECRSSCTTCA